MTIPADSLDQGGTAADLLADLLRALEPGDRARLEAGLVSLTLARGEVLVRQGEPADAIYIVIAGRFWVSLAGVAEPVGEIGAGQPIGEIAFLAGGLRTATVTAKRDSLVMRLGRADFDALSESSPSVWQALTVALARRIAASNRVRTARRNPRPRTITLIRAGQAALPQAFVPAFVEAMRQRGRVAAIAGTPRPGFEPPLAGLDAGEAIRQINRLEDANDHLVLVADDDCTPWTEQALRQADLVLAVAMHESAQQPNVLEKRAAELLGSDARRLVLLHRGYGEISGTANWLAERDMAMHHHAALDAPAHFARLARFIRGEAIGLVACGGGAWSPAHVGVYKALLEHGVTFDIVGGTSGGAAMTAAFALGKTPDEIDRATHDIFITNRALQRWTWPRYSLIDHAHFDRQLAAHYPDAAIEDLWVPFFAVSTNLSHHRLERHVRGGLRDAVRASGSIPVMLPPYYDARGQVLVDGAVMDNLPVRTMHDLKTGPNVVVNFALPAWERRDVDYRALPGRWPLLAQMLNPLGRARLPRAPGLATVLLRTLTASGHDFARHLTETDTLLEPPIPEDVGILDWHRHSELMDAAHVWGRDAFARLDAQTRSRLCPIVQAGTGQLHRQQAGQEAEP